jgi:hypothetical protein
MIKKYISIFTVFISLLLMCQNSYAEPVFAIEATIYKLQSEVTVDSKIDDTLKKLKPIHQPRLLVTLNKSALIALGSEEKFTALEVKTNEDGSYFNASMKLREKIDEQWESITSFIPHISDGQTVYFSRDLVDST